MIVKIRSGKIKNISKKLVVGVLTFTLTTIPLAGCDAISIDNISYTTNKQGDVGFSIHREVLKYCSFYRVYNNKTNKEYYTIGFMDEYNGSYLIKYYDIFTKEEIKYSENTFNSIISVNDYLNELGIEKELYTDVELKEVLDTFLKKQKVKIK